LADKADKTNLLSQEIGKSELPNGLNTFAINEVEEAARGAACLFVDLLPLLDHGFAYSEDRGEHGLADIDLGADATHVFNREGALGREAQRVDPAHGDFIHGADITQGLGGLIGNFQNFTYGNQAS